VAKDEQAAVLQIAGLRLDFRCEGGIVKVTDAERDRWAANVFLFHRASGALVRPSNAYRAQLGRDESDRHGLENRNAIREYATKIYKDRQMLKRRRKNTSSTATVVEPARPVEPTGKETLLGTFGTDPIAFTVYEVAGEDEGPEYRVYGNDGPAGPRLVCWFTADPEAEPVWRGAWNGDDMCRRIEERARTIIANPESGTGS
jgi:hypothetical protein